MSIQHYLFGFSGRINRARIWLWVLIVIALVLVSLALVAVAFDWTATLAAIKAHAAHKPAVAIAKPACKGAVTVIALIVLAVLWLGYIWAKLAIYVKRLHDRARSGWWLLAYLLLPMILNVYACHTGGHYIAVRAHDMSGLGKVAWALAALIGLWVFIDLYCLKGTKGVNQYGADPLEPNWCDPEKPVKGCVPKPE